MTDQNELVTKILKFIDNSKVIAAHEKVEDFNNIQKYVDEVYEWAN